MTISSLVQVLASGDQIALYQLDATIVGGGIYYFTSSTESGAPVLFNGISYFPVDLVASGFEWNGQGPLPHPKIQISNAANFIGAAVITLGDLLGSTLTRIRTFRQFLDDGATPDPGAFYPPDVYRVDRKSNFNKVFIEFELASLMDQQGRMLPGRQIIKNYCNHTYRFYNPATGLFEYTKASCPYTGTSYFDIHGNPVVAALDQCSKLLPSGCLPRFGNAVDLPYRGFPGAGTS